MGGRGYFKRRNFQETGKLESQNQPRGVYSYISPSALSFGDRYLAGFILYLCRTLSLFCTDNMRLRLDSETCGLHGMAVLLQYAFDDGPITLHDVWFKPVRETLNLIESLLEHDLIGFNLVFDMFHLCKVYTIWRLLPPDWIPVEHIEAIALTEAKGQDGPCLKPKNALDLFLYARKGPFQSLMAREDIRIRKVPASLAYALAEELERRVKLDDIYFARGQKGAPRWHVFPREKAGWIDPDFKDVVLRFSAASGLKFLAEYVLKLKPDYHYEDVEPPGRPIEAGFAPTALAVSDPSRGWAVEYPGKKIRHAWPALIKKHAEHWRDNVGARIYAEKDIVYTRELDKYFGCPEPGDDDSILACMVAAVRWHGFKIDIEGIRKLKESAVAKAASSPININKPSEVRRYLYEVMDETEREIIAETTRKAMLEAIRDWDMGEEPCGMADCGPNCPRCGGTGQMHTGPHPAASRAKVLLEAKFAKKEIELYDKLLRAGKFHASFNIIGTLSSRMSGGDGLNAQGINRSYEVRKVFPLSWEGYQLCLGDFDSFEVTLAEAVYKDENLRRDLLAGKKIHALFAMALFPGHTYEQILATAKTDNDLYSKGKQGVFAMIYGGDWTTLVQKLSVLPDDAKRAFADFEKRYPGVKKAREKVFNAFCSMRQLSNKQVVWKDPADYVESFLGFRRYFTLENTVSRELFLLAQKPPKHWRSDLKVIRRDRVQFASGATTSAVFGAAFAIQAANMRAAANHEIQSPGAQITKRLQRRIWDQQPSGVNDWCVAPMNVHDEVLCVTRPDFIDSTAKIVKETVESYRDKVPLIGMEWMTNATTWADK